MRNAPDPVSAALVVVYEAGIDRLATCLVDIYSWSMEWMNRFCGFCFWLAQPPNRRFAEAS